MTDDFKFVEVDPKAIENQLISEYENAIGETLYPGDERRIFLLQLIPIIVGLKNDINDTVKQNFLRYARGEILDAIGGTITPRLKPQKAKVTLEFKLSAPQLTSVVISRGTRVTPDGILYFEAIEDLIIPKGGEAGRVIAAALEEGEKYNKFTPGQIKNIVDPIPYVASVTNIDESSGGADIEDDDHYRDRIRQVQESYSTAGPEGAYIYWAKTADANIADVAVISPSPGVIRVIVLMKEGRLPLQTVLDSVYTAVNAKNRRPLTDKVEVAAPNEILYDIELTYYISHERSSMENKIKSSIEKSIETYKLWQCEKLGRAINPDYLRQLMLEQGAFRIDITNPVYTKISNDSVAKPGTIKITYGGLI